MSCNKKILNFSSINSILAILRAKKYIIYKEPFKLNIIGVRNNLLNPKNFDDYIYVIYKNESNNWIGYRYNATTDPSTKYLIKGGFKDPNKGTAILPGGQYVDTWELGPHGQTGYTALRQQKNLCVYRDYNRDDILNFNIENKDCGKFGINIHRGKIAGADDGEGNTSIIGDYSAGCQVFQNSYCFDEFINLTQEQRSRYGNKFTYTLIDKSLRNKFLFKRLTFVSGISLGILLIYLGIRKTKK